MNRVGLGAAIVIALALLGVLALRGEEGTSSPPPASETVDPDGQPALIGGAPDGEPPGPGLAPSPGDPPSAYQEDEEEEEREERIVTLRGRIVLSDGLRVVEASVRAYALDEDEARTFAEMGLRPDALPSPVIDVTRSTYDGELGKGRYLLALTLAGSRRPVAEAIVQIGDTIVEQDLRVEIDFEGFLPARIRDPDGNAIREGLSFRLDAVDPRVITHGKVTVLQRDDGVLFVRPPPFLTKTNRPVNMRGRPLVLTVISNRYGRREHPTALPRRDPVVVQFERPVRATVRVQDLPKPLQYASHVSLWQRAANPRGDMAFTRMLASRPQTDGVYVFDPLQPGQYEARLFLMATPRRLPDGQMQGGLAPVTLEHFRFEVTQGADEIVLRVPKLHSVRVTHVSDDEGPLALYRIEDDGTRWAHSMAYRHSEYALHLLTPGRYRLESVHKGRAWSLEVPRQTELRLD